MSYIRTSTKNVLLSTHDFIRYHHGSCLASSVMAPLCEPTTASWSICFLPCRSIGPLEHGVVVLERQLFPLFYRPGRNPPDDRVLEHGDEDAPHEQPEVDDHLA